MSFLQLNGIGKLVGNVDLIQNVQDERIKALVITDSPLFDLHRHGRSAFGSGVR